MTRPSDGRMAGGVCAAVARAWGVDVTLVRLVWVIWALMGGLGALAYVICWFVIPEE